MVGIRRGRAGVHFGVGLSQTAIELTLPARLKGAVCGMLWGWRRLFPAGEAGRVFASRGLLSRESKPYATELAVHNA